MALFQSNAYVVKGGLGPKWSLQDIDVTMVLTLPGTSAASRDGLSAEDLAKRNIKHGKYRVTTTEAILAAGGRIWITFQVPGQPDHVTITDLTIAQLNDIFGPPQVTPP